MKLVFGSRFAERVDAWMGTFAKLRRHGPVGAWSLEERPYVEFEFSVVEPRGMGGRMTPMEALACMLREIVGCSTVELLKTAKRRNDELRLTEGVHIPDESALCLAAEELDAVRANAAMHIGAFFAGLLDRDAWEMAIALDYERRTQEW